ncbi:Hypothetical_protein [Hexamita inflata]|uniref:Hypothetical_protein n=1 Tax=Hexamita inflata TaxID=28002 RepID=A0AA86P2K2_9EUKA|nr:Hypothetical protein HINF_LOCUS18096 [Hexamita inflata]CAI9930452.1 Hypothetical protein HINF_LOCUS18097 [Hexamita inflata]CAI9930453.1 Hypothetical protein HINF_LOCUS18098 [Hexamita inflata]CAI9930455.1 Hypothetical protein HINF_LOCUS18100 [Hexamita inflata]
MKTAIINVNDSLNNFKASQSILNNQFSQLLVGLRVDLASNVSQITNRLNALEQNLGLKANSSYVQSQLNAINTRISSFQASTVNSIASSCGTDCGGCPGGNKSNCNSADCYYNCCKTRCGLYVCQNGGCGIINVG